MKDFGNVPRDLAGEKLYGHHHLQIFHRDPGAFIVEIPKSKHSMSNKNQHLLGIKGGLGANTPERNDWDRLRVNFQKERAKAELKRRGILDE